MSAGAHTVTVAPRFEPSSPSASSELSQAARHCIRLATFAALALYGILRWGGLMDTVPTSRLVGLLALAVVLVAAVPLLHRFGPVPPLMLAVVLCLLALPVAGLPWHWFIHDRIAVSARDIGNGLAGLPNALVPYTGASHPVRLVITLGAAVLLLDAAIVVAFAPLGAGDARRAGAALPLIALAVVPSTLVRPQFPYLQGLVLFALLAAFMWGERVRRDAVMSALAITALAGVVGAVAAPRLDVHKPWVDYRAWAGTLAHPHVDAFDWNQTYGPLHWPRKGHVVLTVSAKTGDYWKAENLDSFNGYAWVYGVNTVAPALPAPSPAAVARWSQPIRVRIQGMTTGNVVAAGYASRPSSIPGGVGEANDPGTWITGRTLGPGTSYEVNTYSPQPSPAQLGAAGRDYPVHALSNDLMLAVPRPGPVISEGEVPQITFPPFHSAAPASMSTPSFIPDATGYVTTSPYGRVYALARRLAARAATPYAFVASVLRYLSHGYTYNENPPIRKYPLVSFLFKDRIGYCQQFSGAMALLLRMGGIPARIGTGFTSGTHDAATNQWVVTDLDAHAWVEAWFPHYGWVRFDPTPLAAPARGGKATPAIVKRLPGAGSGSAAAPQRQAQSTSKQSSSARQRSGAGLSPLLIIAAVAVLAALAWLLRELLRSPPSADDRLDELERALSRAGRPLGAGVTLAALEHRFRDSPPAAGYIRSLRLVRYGGVSVRPSAGGRRALREQLRQGLGLPGRMRALWALPPRPALSRRRRGRALKS